MRDALVIGGGPAGAATATLLARAGRDVVLVEREAGPADRVCGEFLSREAGLYLGDLGVDLGALGAVPVDAVRLTDGDAIARVLLPFPAWSLSRRALDEALLERAAAAGATIQRGVAVAELARGSDGYHARLDDGATASARTAFLATGKHDLRGWKRPEGLQNDLLAFKIYFELALAQQAELERHVELILFEGGYAGLQPVEGGRANLCLVVRRARFAALGRRWGNLLAAMRAGSPHLDRRLSGAKPAWARPLALSRIPYGHVLRGTSGPFRLGDQAAVIPSFSGDGMSLALHSAALAVTSYLAGDSADAFQKRLARDVHARVLLAAGLSHGLVRRPTQLAICAAARRFPALVAAVASGTRISDAALARTLLDPAR
jgi:flavin-dependent dehydrogenase